MESSYFCVCVLTWKRYNDSVTMRARDKKSTPKIASARARRRRVKRAHRIHKKKNRTNEIRTKKYDRLALCFAIEIEQIACIWVPRTIIIFTMTIEHEIECSINGPKRTHSRNGENKQTTIFHVGQKECMCVYFIRRLHYSLRIVQNIKIHEARKNLNSDRFQLNICCACSDDAWSLCESTKSIYTVNIFSLPPWLLISIISLVLCGGVPYRGALMCVCVVFLFLVTVTVYLLSYNWTFVARSLRAYDFYDVSGVRLGSRGLHFSSDQDRFIFFVALSVCIFQVLFFLFLSFVCLSLLHTHTHTHTH